MWRYPGDHGHAPQPLGDVALHGPLERLLDRDDVILHSGHALLPGGQEVQEHASDSSLRLHGSLFTVPGSIAQLKGIQEM